MKETWINRLISSGPFALLFLVAIALRCVRLEVWPTPAGDEGTWGYLSYELFLGRDAQLYDGAGFVTLVFPKLIAASYALLGPSYLSARLVGVCATLVAIFVTYVLLLRLGSRRAALVSAAFLALHPWSILWARTASVPYALALCTMTVGPLLWLYGLHRHQPISLVLAVLVIAWGANFSPLTVIAALACLLWTLQAQNRWALRNGWVYLACAVALLQVVPIIKIALNMATTLPSPTPQQPFVQGLYSYLHTVLTGLCGEATLRHFTHAAVSPTFSWVLALPVVIALAMATTARRREGPLSGFGVFYCVLAMLVVPLVLLPARSWQLERIDTDRYLFAILPAAAFAFGELAAVATRKAWVSLAVAGLVVTLGTVRTVYAFHYGGGPDHGVMIFNGGGAYRGWQVAKEGVSTLQLLRSAITRNQGRAPATLVVADWSFHTLYVQMLGSRIRVAELAKIPDDRVWSAQRRYYFVVWNDSMLAFPPGEASPVEANRRLKQRMQRDFRNIQRLRSFVQPNGYPLFELWQAQSPVRH